MSKTETKQDRNILKLNKPILIDGKEVSELAYDSDEITVELYSTACAKAGVATLSGGTDAARMRVKEVDYILHNYLGMAAIIAVNSHISFEDLERIKGFDIMKVSEIGHFFTFGKSADLSARKDSVNSAEATPDTSV